MVEVRQEDREAAARYWGNDNPPLELQREFARHRIAALEEAATELERQDGHGEWSEAATAIRALKGPTDDPA